MNTEQSVYPSALADKCVDLLCARHPRVQNTASSLWAGRQLMMQGFVIPRDGRNWQSMHYAVLSPDTPRFYYDVDLASEVCTCADFLRTQRPCKHLCAAVLTLLARRCLGLVPEAARANARAK